MSVRVLIGVVLMAVAIAGIVRVLFRVVLMAVGFVYIVFLHWLLLEKCRVPRSG